MSLLRSKDRITSEFTRNVITLMTGTTLAQAIPISVAPILTRIYTPSDFGVFAIYMALVAVISVVVTGRYEQAIMLPEDDKDAFTLVVLTIAITSVISIMVLLFVVCFNERISHLLGNSEIGVWLYMVPLSVFIAGIYQALSYWANRSKRYKSLVGSRVVQSASMSLIQVVGGGVAKGAAPLMVGDVCGRVISMSMLIRSTINIDRSMYTTLKICSMTALAKRYKKFPIFDTGASIANVGSYQVQNILFPMYYGLISAGQYFLVLKVMQAPLSLISASLTDVYKQRLSSKDTAEQQLKGYYSKMLVALIVAGFVPFSVVFMWGENIFVAIFGDEWGEAGVYAAILSPMFYARFVASPLSYFLYLKEKQEINIIGNLMFLGSAFMAVRFSHSAVQAVELISVSFSLVYLAYIIYAGKLSGALRV